MYIAPTSTVLPGQTPSAAAPAFGARAQQDETDRVGAAATLWVSILFVTYLWAGNGGMTDLKTWETGLVSTGRLTGLVASILLLAQVLMMARLPILESAFGQDRLASLHRIIGFTSFNLMLAHIVLISYGYAAGDLKDTPGTFWDLIVNYPGMLIALAGTACLILTVVTSIKAARRKIRYESWHLLHLYAYLGVGLALPHQLWTGQEFLNSKAATVFWWTAWAATAAAVLIWRVGVPISRNLRHQLTVAAVVREAKGVHSVYFTGRKLDQLAVEAGQFFNWRFLSGPGWTRGHPYSLSAAPDGRHLRITVKDLGDGSKEIVQLKPGTRVLFEGPFGRLTDRPRTQRKVALIGAGVGITPIRALAEGLTYAPGDAILLHRYAREPLFERELTNLGYDRGLHVVPLPGHRRSPDSWLGTGIGNASDLTALRHWVPDIASRDVYICGPEQWTADVRTTLVEAGVGDQQIHIENFAW